MKQAIVIFLAAATFAHSAAAQVSRVTIAPNYSEIRQARTTSSSGAPTSSNSSNLSCDRTGEGSLRCRDIYLPEFSYIRDEDQTLFGPTSRLDGARVPIIAPAAMAGATGLGIAIDKGSGNSYVAFATVDGVPVEFSGSISLAAVNTTNYPIGSDSGGAEVVFSEGRFSVGFTRFDVPFELTVFCNANSSDLGTCGGILNWIHIARELSYVR